MSFEESDPIVEHVERLSGLTVSRSMSGKRSTTFCIGGTYKYFLEPHNEAELVSAVKAIREAGQEYRVLGAGSNLLVSDGGIASWVFRLGKGFRSFEQKRPGVFFVQGSMSLMTLSRELSEAGFSGLEFAGGIPASFGGAVRMNAGAHGSEMSSVLNRVRFLSVTGDVEEVSKGEMQFSYRKSGFSNGSIVLGAEIELVSADAETVRRNRAEHLAERKKRQPLSYPSAGSVFKNPEGGYPSAGALIEECGLKGYAIGGAEVSRLHGNWIINPAKSACANDVAALIAHCQSTVAHMKNLTLEAEVVTWR